MNGPRPIRDDDAQGNLELIATAMTAGRLALAVGALGVSVASAKDNPLTHLPDMQRPSASSGCEAFGPGFRRLDGLDSCIKIDGHVRVESSYVSGGASFLPAASWTK